MPESKSKSTFYGREELLESCELLEAELEHQLFQSPDYDWEDLILFQQSINTSAKVIFVCSSYLKIHSEPGFSSI